MKKEQSKEIKELFKGIKEQFKEKKEQFKEEKTKEKSEIEKPEIEENKTDKPESEKSRMEKSKTEETKAEETGTEENMEKYSATEDLIRWIGSAPTAYQAVDMITEELNAGGYTRLSESENWSLQSGGKYYVTRNGSSVIAFALPENAEIMSGFLIAASHTDSPSFKLKANAESVSAGIYTRLNTECYGGMIMSSWLDRPLSVAGRVITCENGRFRTHSVQVKRDLCVIPGVAIHFNRKVNDGYTYNPAVDLQPLFADQTGKGKLKEIVAREAGVDPETVVDMDLFLYNRTPGCVFGADDCFFSSPRIDNLMCAYGTLKGFLNSAADPACSSSSGLPSASASGSSTASSSGLSSVLSSQTAMVKVYACFDNEETGSGTKQGAASPFAKDTLERIAQAFGKDLRRMAANSFMVSADNGHAVHPNHPELSDGENGPKMNGGVVIKFNAAQKYTSDAMSAAIFRTVCEKAGVPVQNFANRSDIAGGSTLGSISNVSIPMLTVDIGMAQLAMHSAYETAGAKDTDYLIRTMTKFYEAGLHCEEDGVAELVL